MNKSEIVAAILEKLREEFEHFRAVSKRTRSAGNDSESKSEGKYDTRSIEENYLADGLAKQAAASAQAAAAYEGFELNEFTAETPLDLGALIQVRFPTETTWFFLGPAGGGIEIPDGNRTLTVITPESPLGKQLIGLKVGDRTTAPKAKILAVE